MSKPTRKVLTLDERVKVINLSKAGKSGRQIADEIGVGKTHIQGILKRKAKIMEDFESNMSPDRKRVKRVTGNEEINRLTWEFFKDCRARNAVVNGPLLKARALKFANDLGKYSFSASNGWLSAFLKRNNIVFGAMSGERADTSIDWDKSAKDLLLEECGNDSESDAEIIEAPEQPE